MKVQFSDQAHWNNIFAQKANNEKSWFQAYPATSMQFIQELGLPKNAAVIDAGGGDSLLADALLENGYTDITVIDISETAIKNAQARLGSKARQVDWIVGDILKFQPSRHYDCWHDRAVFHFVIQPENILSYTKLMADAVGHGGALIVGTFAQDGPEKCSNLPVQRYSQTALVNLLQPAFQKIKCIHEIHQTPFNTGQPFTFCSFRRA